MTHRSFSSGWDERWVPGSRLVVGEDPQWGKSYGNDAMFKFKIVFACRDIEWDQFRFVGRVSLVSLNGISPTLFPTLKKQFPIMVEAGYNACSYNFFFFKLNSLEILILLRLMSSNFLWTSSKSFLIYRREQSWMNEGGGEYGTFGS